jgi:hypothetical protein
MAMLVAETILNVWLHSFILTPRNLLLNISSSIRQSSQHLINNLQPFSSYRIPVMQRACRSRNSPSILVTGCYWVVWCSLCDRRSEIDTEETVKSHCWKRCVCSFAAFTETANKVFLDSLAQQGIIQFQQPMQPHLSGAGPKARRPSNVTVLPEKSAGGSYAVWRLMHRRIGICLDLDRRDWFWGCLLEARLKEKSLENRGC